MDRYTNQDGASFQPGEEHIWVEFVAGTSGAVPSALSGYVRADGIASMALAATGLYTVTLQDSYVACLGGSFDVMQATYSAAAGWRGAIVSKAVTGTTPTVVFQCVRPDTGAAIAVVEGDTVIIHLVLQRISPS